MSDTTTDFFDVSGGPGAPTASLKNVGDFVHGEITEMFKRDYVPFGKTDPEVKADGTKRQQMVVVLQTTLRNWQNVSKVPLVDPKDESKGYKDPSEDDGRRAIYAPEGSNIQFAIGRAIQAANARFEVGGTLGVKIHNLKDTGKGNPLKEHEAVYTAKPAGGDFFGGTPAAAPAQPAAAPAQAPAAAPAPQAPAAQPAPAAAPAQAAPLAQDPWATQAAPAAPAGDPWATAPAPATSQPPF